MDETRCDGSFWNNPSRLRDSPCVQNTTSTRQKRRRGRILHVATAMAACLVTASAASSSQQDNDSGYHDVQPYCQRNYVKVSKMWLLCDSPGAYYYGGSAYRNSEVCMSGDKAKLRAQSKSVTGHGCSLWRLPNWLAIYWDVVCRCLCFNLGIFYFCIHTRTHFLPPNFAILALLFFKTASLALTSPHSQ